MGGNRPAVYLELGARIFTAKVGHLFHAQFAGLHLLFTHHVTTGFVDGREDDGGDPGRAGLFCWEL